MGSCKQKALENLIMLVQNGWRSFLFGQFQWMLDRSRMRGM
jgi:hypothetical protein